LSKGLERKYIAGLEAFYILWAVLKTIEPLVEEGDFEGLRNLAKEMEPILNKWRSST